MSGKASVIFPAVAERLAEQCFEPWEIIKPWLISLGIEISEDNHGQASCKGNTGLTVGFNWQSMDIYTRGHQLQFLFFGRPQIELRPHLDEIYRINKKRKKKK